MKIRPTVPTRQNGMLDARLTAQRLVFGPFLFQASKQLRDLGILAVVSEAEEGLSYQEIGAATDLPEYTVRALVDVGLVAEVLAVHGQRFRITNVGYMILHDELTRVNMDFMHDVCYEGSFQLGESLARERPVGLEVFGGWSTIYEALQHLPEPVRRSWFAFDHFYSDSAFDAALDVVLASKPRRILDIGGNTGRFALRCLAADPEVQVTLLDLPGQLKDARAALEAAGFADRVRFHAADLLKPEQPIPDGHDLIWMSQFLVCFSKEEIRSILRRSAAALGPGGRMVILDNFWDRQRFDVGRAVVLGSSLYFTCMANGNSRTYRAEEFVEVIEDLGLSVLEIKDDIGLSGSILDCARPAGVSP
jgi:SAM-dependent methyltransferase